VFRKERLLAVEEWSDGLAVAAQSMQHHGRQFREGAGGELFGSTVILMNESAILSGGKFTRWIKLRQPDVRNRGARRMVACDHECQIFYK
jgi:hypothetical protein